MTEIHRPSLLNRISTQLYAGLAVAVAFMLAASIVGWISFQRIDRAQRDLHESSITQMEAAFAITEHTGALVTAAARLTTAHPEDYDEVVSDVDETKRKFQSQLQRLQDLVTDDEQALQLRVIRRFGNTLIANLSTISADVPKYHELTEQHLALKSQADAIYADLNLLADEAIDDQFFFVMTGFREIDAAPESRDVHLAERELSHYRYLRTLRSDSAYIYGLLVDAFIATEESQIEPLRESFVFATHRLDLSAAALPDSDLVNRLRNTLPEIYTLGEGEPNTFDVADTRLQILHRQDDSLAQNLEAEASLVREVSTYVESAQAAAADAAQKSSQAIRAGRLLLVAISALGTVGALAVSWLYIGRLLVRRISTLSDRMRTLAEGDIETEIEIKGRDEVADMAAALEVFRQHSLEVQRLNLVEKLAQELSEKNEQLESALEDLGSAQNQIVAREKLAALGEVTAGVAHEIRNPLNFIKNFSEASEELLEELLEIIAEVAEAVSEDDREYIDEITDDLTQNLKRIRSHGDRANRIVEDMLRMGRGASGTETTNINTLVRDHAMLAYHSARAADPEFNVNIEEDFDPQMGQLDLVSQDMGRVFLNLVANAGYASNEKHNEFRMTSGDDFRPTVRITTRRTPENAVIAVWDNGTGIPPDVAARVFEPFFTTKPTDKGTGLGLAMSNDIVRSHGGTLTVDSEPGEFTEFVVTLPLTPQTALP